MASVPTALGAVINKSEGTGTGTSIFHPRGPVAAQIWGTDEPSRKDMNNALGVDHDLGIKVSIAALLKDDDAEWIKSHIVTADGSPKTSGATISLYKGDNVQDYTFTTDKVAKTFQREQVETNWWWIGYEKAVLDALGADDNDEGKITEDQADPEKVLKILTGKKVSKKTDLSGSDYLKYLQENMVVLESKTDDNSKYLVVDKIEGDDAKSAEVDTMYLDTQFWVYVQDQELSDLQDEYDTLIVVE